MLETTKTQRRVKELQVDVGSLTGGDHSRTLQEVLARIGSLLRKQFLARCLWFLELKCGEDGVVMEKMYSMLTVGPL